MSNGSPTFRPSRRLTLSLAGAGAVAALARPLLAAAQGVSAPAVTHVANAGLVLLGPFIPEMFVRAKLTREGVFLDGGARELGVHLLQLLVAPDPPLLEPQLALNKVLCGLDPATPVSRDYAPGPRETAAAGSLLGAVIRRWPARPAPSITALRETFLQREGLLAREESVWRLRVAPRGVDALIDRLPWSFSTVKLPWMAQAVRVDWR